ncbi:MAG: threonylcarbamoyl-AMP synthase [Rhizobiales bacterium]|nr:threonylcarbamoyl-AMP synthase [Hyphomicrobiales bacterium]
MSPLVNAAEIAEAARILRDGGLVAFPTETVYGLGADATSDRAVARVYEAKGRPTFNPLIVHVPDLAAAEKLGEFPAPARRLAEVFWPGPLTIVVPRRKDCPVSLLASAGLPSLALRVPAHPIAQGLLKAVDRPVVAPSANPSGRMSPTTAAHVRAGLGRKVDLILDGGACRVGVESTIVGFLGREPQLLRPGGIVREDIERVMGHRLATASAGDAPVAPGQLESHYAPHAALRLDAERRRSGEIYLGFGKRDGDRNLSPSGDLVEAAANLFRMLHELDETGTKSIAVAPIPHEGLGEAINDRLRRAAAPRSRE